MNHLNKIEKIRVFVESGKYEDAFSLIKQTRKEGCNDVVLTLFEALAMYDSGDDLQTIYFLSNFIELAKNHEKRDYALFTVGICLMNLGLSAEAKIIFTSLPDDYPDIDQERKHARCEETKQKQALSYFLSINENRNF